MNSLKKKKKRKRKMYLFGCTGSWLQHDPSSSGHVESFSAVCRLACCEVYGILVPQAGIRPAALLGRFLATAAPGRSRRSFLSSGNRRRRGGNRGSQGVSQGWELRWRGGRELPGCGFTLRSLGGLFGSLPHSSP